MEIAIAVPKEIIGALLQKRKRRIAFERKSSLPKRLMNSFQKFRIPFF